MKLSTKGRYGLRAMIDLALVEMPAGVITGNRPVHGQYIRLIMVFCHNDQLSMVELLIAEDVYKRQAIPPDGKK